MNPPLFVDPPPVPLPLGGGDLPRNHLHFAGGDLGGSGHLRLGHGYSDGDRHLARREVPEWDVGRIDPRFLNNGTPLNDYHLKMIRAWKINFTGEDPKRCPESFLTVMREFAQTHGLAEDRLLMALPIVLESEALVWWRVHQEELSNWETFTSEIRDEFGPIDYQVKLESEVRARTQGVTERVSTYVNSMRLLFRHFKQPWSIEAQLQLIYRNMHPPIRRRIPREDVISFKSLESKGREIELSRELDREYKPPPTVNRSLLPEAACRDKSVKLSSLESEGSPESDDENDIAPERCIPDSEDDDVESTSSPESDSESEDEELESATDSESESEDSEPSGSESESDNEEPTLRSREDGDVSDQGDETLERPPLPPVPCPPCPYPYPYPVQDSCSPLLHPQAPFPFVPPCLPDPAFPVASYPAPVPMPRVARSCHNCGQVGHLVRECRYENQGIKCFGCRAPGFTRKTCPKCNGQRFPGN